MSNIWKAFERTGASGAPLYNWRIWLGEEFELLLAHRFLCHSSEKAESLSVDDRFGYPERYRVVEHSPKDVVAISEEGERLPILPADRMIVKVDYHKLAESFANACGFDNPSVTTAPQSCLFRIGKTIHPKRGYVFASFNGSESTNMGAFALLQRHGIRDANIFLLSHEQATSTLRTMAFNNGWEILLIREYFNFTPILGFVVKGGRSPLGLSSNAAVDRWMLKRPETPAWKHIQIRFPEDDNERVHISFGRHGRLFEYREILQFTDKRTRKPNKQWFLLRRFAETGGVSQRIVRGRESREREKIYRQLVALMKALKIFFGIPTDPFKDVDSETVALFDVGMKGKHSRVEGGEKSEDIGEIFEEISSHDRLHKPAYDIDLD